MTHVINLGLYDHQNRAAIRGAAAWLEARPQLGQQVFRREQARIIGEYTGREQGRAGDRDTDRGIDIVVSFRACLVALRVPNDVTAYSTVAAGIRPGGRFGGFPAEGKGSGPARELACRTALACTVVAGLELARGCETSLAQAGALALIFFGRLHLLSVRRQVGLLELPMVSTGPSCDVPLGCCCSHRQDVRRRECMPYSSGLKAVMADEAGRIERIHHL